ncbi:MAG: PIN-like domain-containing protein [Opitutaceae bacterium]
MKEKFPGHFKLSDEEIRNMWEDGIFVLDANILLNLYRYSDDTRRQFLKILRRLKSRVWIPHQAAKEYLKNRLGVIGQQEKAYEQTIDAIGKIETDLKSKRQHPFLSDKSLESLCKSFDAVKKELDKSKSSHTTLIADDKILDSIERLIGGRIGDGFDEKVLESIAKEGETRYASNIPPGYKDASKKSEGDPYRKFGDLIIWKEVIEKAKSENKNIILVLDDKKEDWWLKFQGNTIGPQPELTEEFIKETGQKFHMYVADRFLAYAGEFLQEDVSVPALEELKKLRELEEFKNRRKREMMRRRRMKERNQMLREELPEIEAELSMLKQQRRFFDDEMKHLHENNPERANHEFRRSRERVIELEEREMMLKEKMHHIMSELSDLESYEEKREPTRRWRTTI